MKVLVFNTVSNCGDLLTFNGLLNNLQKYYDKIILYLPPQKELDKEKRLETLHEFGKELYKNITKLEIVHEYKNLINIYPNLHLLDSYCNHGDTYKKNNWFNLSNNRYIHRRNPLYNVINVDKNDICPKNIKPISNSDHYYISLGLKTSIRLDEFIYERNKEEEDKVYEKFKKDKYVIICEFDKHWRGPNNKENFLNKDFIKNKDLPKINIHFLVKNQLFLLKLIENAEEIHLMEGSLALMIYHMQYLNIMKRMKIYFHTYCRPTRMACVDMMLMPKLENWELIK
jgi:hypothetical protein